MTTNVQDDTSEERNLLDVLTSAGYVPEPVTGRDPLLLEPAGKLWLVATGGVEVFVTDPDDETRSYRTHVARVDAGGLLIGAGGDEALPLHFLAAGTADTTVVELDAAGLVGAVGGQQTMDLLADWVTGVCLAQREVQATANSATLEPGGTVDLEGGRAASVQDDLVWIEVIAGTLTIGSRPHAPLAHAGAEVPLVRGEWVISAESVTLTTRTTAEALGEPAAAATRAAAINASAIETLAKMRDASEATERDRIARKTAFLGSEVQATLRDIATSLDPRDTAVAAPPTDNKLFAAFAMVMSQLGLTAVQPPQRNVGGKNPIDALARSSKVKTRKVKLVDEWWRADGGPFVGTINDDGKMRPVALIPRTAKAYRMHDPADGSIVDIDASNAERVASTAFQIYRPLPLDRPITGIDLFRFGLRGLKKDLITILVAGVATGLLALLPAIFTGYLFNEAIPNSETNLVVQVGISLAVSALAISAFTIAQGIAISRIAVKAQIDIEAAMLDRLINMSPSFFREYAAGDLTTRVTGIESILQAVSSQVIGSVLTAVFSVFQLVLMFLYSPLLSLIAAVLLAIAAAIVIFAGRLQMTSAREIVALDRELNSTLVQVINGVSKIRVSGAESRIFTRIANKFLEKNKAEVRQQKIFNGLSTFTSTYTVIVSVTMYSAVAFLLWNPDRGSEIDSGTFLAFNAAFAIVMFALLGLTSSFQTLAQVGPLYAQMKPIMEATPEIDEARADPGELTGAIELQGVNFRYSEDGPVVLKDVSFSVEPGEFLALVGPSGSGKSTCLRMLLGFDVPQSGKVFYDGQDLETIDLQGVRQQLGVVMQGGTLMAGPVWENIVGASGGTIDDAWDAARAAGMEDDIEAMPMGMHTMINAGATTISGGQRQRLLIARALVGKPRIIFFDEATSALDNETQQTVTDSLDNMQSTRIVIAHRLSTIQNANKIVVIVNGEVVEEGNFDDLMAQNGAFAAIARRQIA